MRNKTTIFRKTNRIFLVFLFQMVSVFSFGNIQDIPSSKKLVISFKQATIKQIFKDLEKRTDFVFNFGQEVSKDNRTFSFIYKEKTLQEIVDDLSKNIGFDYEVNKSDINIRLLYNKKSSTGSIQVNSINGKVTDALGQALPGASIVEKGTKNATTTDLEGNFKLTVSDKNAVLLVSFIGYKTKEVATNGKSNIQIQLAPEESKLDEVVVVGYGSQKKAKITGSISSIKLTEVDKTAFTSVDQLLQGRAAGLQLSNVSGNPGGQQRVNIRGVGSLQGDNQPLYVIDGIPISNTEPSETAAAKFGRANITNPLALINPNDIESIEILKDASAAAIYGSRGTNGVILITTKTGKKGVTKTSVSHYSGAQIYPTEIDVASTEQYLKIVNEARTNFNIQNSLTPQQSTYLKPILDPRTNGQKDTDWFSLITREAALITDTNISFSGGNEKTKFYYSIGHFDQEGIIKTNQFKRIALNLNISHEISPNLKLTNKLIASHSINNRVVSHSSVSLLSDSREQRPFDTVYDDQGNYNDGGSVRMLRNNAVRGINESKSDYNSYRLINNTTLDVKTPIKGLHYSTNIGIDFGLYHDRLFWTPNFRFAAADGGQLTDSRNIAVKTLLNNQFVYVNNFGKLDYELTIVHALEKFKIDRTFIEGIGFPFESNGSLSTATSVRTSTFGTPPGVGNAIGNNAIESFIGRATFDYDKKYLLNIAIRRDGSSQFATGRKYGNFPSASLGWKFTEENFFKKNKYFNSGKIRASYGITGNTNGINDFASLAIVTGGFSYNGQQGAVVTQTGNDLLSWENSTQFNVGLNLDFFQNRVQFSFDYFNKKTTDLLFAVPVVATSGFSTLTQNAGELTNKGFEFQLFVKPIVSNNFEWNVDFNITMIENNISKLPNSNPINVGFAHILKEGNPVGSFFLLKQLGVYQDNSEVPATLFSRGVRAGDIKFEDINNDGLINANDRQIVGKALPDVFGGMTHTIKYKSFDLNLFSTFSIGNDVFANYRRRLDDFGNLFNKRVEAIDNRWTGPGTSNTFPRAIANDAYNNQNSTRFLEDGSFFRLKTLTFGYSPKLSENSKFIKNLRVFATATNLFTFTKYSGLDPETSDSLSNLDFGVDLRSAPLLKTYTIGLNMSL